MKELGGESKKRTAQLRKVGWLSGGSTGIPERCFRPLTQANLNKM